MLAVALANKLARIARSVLARGRGFEARKASSRVIVKPAQSTPASTDVCKRMKRRWRFGLPGACEN